MNKKILLSLLALSIIPACSSDSSMENNTDTSMSTKEQNETTTMQNESPVYGVYKYEVDAVICDKSKKGDYTLCDLKGRTVTGFVKSEGSRTIAYYENGEQMNGIVLDADNKTPKTFFKRNDAGNISTVVNYYSDGSIKSKEVTNTQVGSTDKNYKKGNENNPYYDQSQINMLIDVYNRN